MKMIERFVKGWFGWRRTIKREGEGKERERRERRC
jgi:hypothetical protein